MTEEQIKQKFKETYPDLMRGDTPLSPYFDIWEYAIETATNELQEELEQWKSEWQEQVQKATDEGYARTLLQIENKKLKEQIEKMKCCGNCENRYGQEKCADCHNYSKWKFKQAEQFYEEIVE